MTIRKNTELPPSSWRLNPGYEIDLIPLSAAVTVELGGEVLAQSKNARVMYELGHAPVFYIPRDDVRGELLSDSDHHSHCPYKGDAGYLSVRAGGVISENAIWYYDQPYDEMRQLKGLLGFYFERFDAWLLDGLKIDAPPEIDGRVNQQNNFARLHPSLAAEWHAEKNGRIKPYEFSAESETLVWWKNADNDEWRESIRSRVERERS